nr:adaptor protein MecA [uncultured Bacillus sp.]
MDIERINDYTVKFYISYVDMEERGFDREEIWYNRDRSEELFWEMMDEVHNEEEFLVEGPLWIQVQALDKGLEIVVTKAQVSKDGHKFELPISGDKFGDQDVEDHLEDLLDHYTPMSDDEIQFDDHLEFLVKFKDLEDIIALSKRSDLDELTSKMYVFEGTYYMFFDFTAELFEESDVDNIMSVILEFGHESSLSIHRIEEYGKLIIDSPAIPQIRKYFK